MATPYGITVEWLKDKSEIDFTNAVQGVDYKIIRSAHLCSQGDLGTPIVGLPDNMEWLALYSEDNYSSEFDYDFWEKLSETKPSNEAHPLWPNYKTYKTTTRLVKRENDVLFSNVELAETEANLSLTGDGLGVKINILQSNITAKLATGTALSETELNIQATMVELAKKILDNADNAKNLKAAILRGENPDIKSGWAFKSSCTGYPFTC